MRSVFDGGANPASHGRGIVGVFRAAGMVQDGVRRATQKTQRIANCGNPCPPSRTGQYLLALSHAQLSAWNSVPGFQVTDINRAEYRDIVRRSPHQENACNAVNSLR